MLMQMETFELSAEVGYVGKIPIRNLWLLMLYASQLFSHLEKQKSAIEDNPDEIPDLVAEILAHSVDVRLRRNLTIGYRRNEAPLDRVRGRIDHLVTESHQLLARGKIYCQFEQITIDTPRNRYIRAALEKIANIVSRSDLSHRCRVLALTMKRRGVTGEISRFSALSIDQVGHYGAQDQQMLAAARLAFDLALPTESLGNRVLVSPDRKERWLRTLFESAIAGFYNTVLPHPQWRVDAGRTLAWQIEGQSREMQEILPSMRTDIILESSGPCHRIVIDTKFTSIVKAGWYRNESLNSGYIYQMYAYLRSQEGIDALSYDATGLLLHPAVDKNVDERVRIQGHCIRFATVNLADAAIDIRNRLLTFVQESQ